MGHELFFCSVRLFYFLFHKQIAANLVSAWYFFSEFFCPFHKPFFWVIFWGQSGWRFMYFFGCLVLQQRFFWNLISVRWGFCKVHTVFYVGVPSVHTVFFRCEAKYTCTLPPSKCEVVSLTIFFLLLNFFFEEKTKHAQKNKMKSGEKKLLHRFSTLQRLLCWEWINIL